MIRNRALAAFVLAGVALVAGLLVRPGNTAPVPAGDFDRSVRPFLAKHCLECHGEKTRKGDLRLDDLPADPRTVEDRERWQGVVDRIVAGTMPPPKKPRPPKADADTVVARLRDGLAAAEVARRKAEGRAGLRRLNRVEYENTVSDLLGVRLDLADRLPPDAIVRGFDNLGDALTVSPTQMQRYLDAAGFAIDAAIARGARPEMVKKAYAYAEGRNAEFLGKQWLKRADGAVVIFNNGIYPSTRVDGFRATARGRHIVRVRGDAYQSKEPIPFAVYYGNLGRGGDSRLAGYFELPPGEPTTVELTLDLDPGDGLDVQPFGLKGVGAFKPEVGKGLETFPGPGLAIVSVEVEGPILADWPSAGHKLLFGDLPLKPKGKPPAKGPVPMEVVSADPASDAHRLLPGFLRRAFRRPVTPADAAPYLALFDAETKQGATFVEAMATAATAALCSPEFLYLREKPGPLDDHALACRLSYFLARTMPDDELARLADAGRLRRPEVLREQTERLLRHPNAARFAADFTDAWLGLRDIDFTTPDKSLYPEFDALLQDSMVRETRGFFGEVLAKNLPATTFLASDFAFLNGRLARHYGIPGVEGLAVRRVPLPADSVRGGLLTQGALLKVSANGTNTSPVVRGVYVLERFLGVTPPAPPPGVPAVEPDIRGATTLRELLDKHRNVETCAGCHRLIDPPGFALEEFDVIGGRRDRFRIAPPKPGQVATVDGKRMPFAFGQKVDAAGETTDGKAFADFAGFRKLLLAEPDRFVACLAGKLLTFATGREVGPSDTVEIERLMRESAGRKHAFRELVHAAIQSETFRNK